MGAERRQWERRSLSATILFKPADGPGGNPFNSGQMRNISEGGVSFWSRHELDLGAVIYLREFSSGKSQSWIPARIKHRTMGLRGYLIGASFELNKVSGAAGAPPQHLRGPVVPPQTFPPGWRGPRR